MERGKITLAVPSDPAALIEVPDVWAWTCPEIFLNWDDKWVPCTVAYYADSWGRLAVCIEDHYHAKHKRVKKVMIG